MFVMVTLLDGNEQMLPAAKRLSIAKSFGNGRSVEVVDFDEGDAGGAVGAADDGGVVAGIKRGGERAFGRGGGAEADGGELDGLEGVLLPVVIGEEEVALAVAQLERRIGRARRKLRRRSTKVRARERQCEKRPAEE